MRAVSLVLLASLAACGGSTEPGSTRYNFAIVDGTNQISTAGAPGLAKPITSKLARDPQGKFASWILDVLSPTIAYAQGIVVKGEPVANTLVCGRESAPGEPKVEPLCVFTLADGSAPSEVKGGTKAGEYNIVFTAQVPSEAPVKDSTTVTVQPGPAASNFKFTCNNFSASGEVVPAEFVVDDYGNSVPYRIVGDSLITIPGLIAGTPDARRVTFTTPTSNKRNRYTPIVDADGKQIGLFDYTLLTDGSWTCQTWGMVNKPA